MKMIKRFTIAIFLLSPLAALSQGIVSGHVKHGKKGLALVLIYVLGGKDSTRTDEFGRFSLPVSGDTKNAVSLFAAKEGFRTSSRLIVVSPKPLSDILLFESDSAKPEQSGKTIARTNRIIVKGSRQVSASATIKQKCLTGHDSLSCSLWIEEFENKYKPLIKNSTYASSMDPMDRITFSDCLISLDKIERAVVNIYVAGTQRLDMHSKVIAISDAKEIIDNEEKSLVLNLRRNERPELRKNGWYQLNNGKSFYSFYGEKINFTRIDENFVKPVDGVKPYYISDPISNRIVRLFLQNDTSFRHYTPLSIVPDDTLPANILHAADVLSLSEICHLQIPNFFQLENAATGRKIPSGIWEYFFLEYQSFGLLYSENKSTNDPGQNYVRKRKPDDYILRYPIIVRLVK